ncbi:MAG: cytochrome c3 family protein [Pseudomonadota bacterium]|nr:cytochrome c3 family protein [Pseudomonadota bacterium]HJO36412.1 cytochrome c3 family protein [Gammaproteobacteria bacterium]
MASSTRRTLIWGLWLLLSAGIGLALGYRLLGGAEQTVFMPGEMSYAHHQFGVDCQACHGEAFAGGEALQAACLDCHGEQMRARDDSHPRSKFTDPRNAALLTRIEARECVTCHLEHRPEITGPMQVTLPIDFCANCHQDIATERPSHEGLGFASCADAGCHNYHDNRALYEDFLLAHLQESPVLADPRLPVATAIAPHGPALTAMAADHPPTHALSAEQFAAWAGSGHAAGGVNCRDCHGGEADLEWVAEPAPAACESCHGAQVAGWRLGRHGMRAHEELSQPLPPLAAADARLPMAPDAPGTPGCTSCHRAHDFDLVHARVEACLGCHADPHSRSYADSPHAALWQAEREGRAPPGSGVTCASCHLPVVERAGAEGEARWLAEHNQSAHLRPNEQFIRPVCLNCHGMGFTLDALADEALIERNFTGRPAGHVDSLDMVAARLRDAPTPAGGAGTP